MHDSVTPTKAGSSVVRFTAECDFEFDLSNLTEEWVERFLRKLALCGFELKGPRDIRIDDEALCSEAYFDMTDRADGIVTVLPVQNDGWRATHVYFNMSVPYRPSGSEMINVRLHQLERLCLAVAVDFNCTYTEMVYDGDEHKLWLIGPAEHLDTFGRYEWNSDPEIHAIDEWVTSSAAVSPWGASIQRGNHGSLLINAGNQAKALLLQSPINGMLLPVPSDALDKYFCFDEQAYFAAIDLALPHASLEALVSSIGPPDFELPPVKFKEDWPSVVRQVGYSSLSPNHVVIYRQYANGRITAILAGKKRA